MTNSEAVTRTIEGIWNTISSKIKDSIEIACDEGEFEVRIEASKMMDKDIERLSSLGYNVDYNDEDKFFPEYIISWR